MKTVNHARVAFGPAVPEPAEGSIAPILQEVYDIKAKLNAEAGYSVQTILERARRNIELALAEADVFVPVIAIPEEILESLK